MNDKGDQAHGSGLRWRTPMLLSIIVLGFAFVVGLSRWMDEHRPVIDTSIEEERLYMTGAAVRRMSLGFNGLVADWYWMRSLQYIGNKMLNHQGRIQIAILPTQPENSRPAPERRPRSTAVIGLRVRRGRASGDQRRACHRALEERDRANPSRGVSITISVHLLAARRLPVVDGLTRRRNCPPLRRGWSR